MRTAIIIPARLAATRLPNKPLALLGDKPVVVRTLAQAQKCLHVDVVAVATDSEAIAAAVRAHGGMAVMTAAHHTCGTERVAEAAQALDVDLVVNLQGDEPFIDPRDLDTVIAGLRSRDVEMATLSAPITELADFLNPNVVKVVTRSDDTALYFSRAPIPYERAQTGSLDNARRHVGVYGYRRSALKTLAAAPPHPLEKRESLEQLRALAMGMRILVLPAVAVTRGIDTPEDLTWAQARFALAGEAAFP